MEFKTGHAIIDMGAISLDSVAEVPASGYSTATPGPVQGNTYALQLADGTYAAVEILTLGDCRTLFNVPPTACTSTPGTSTRRTAPGRCSSR